jgi:hypothetical protein
MTTKSFEEMVDAAKAKQPKTEDELRLERRLASESEEERERAALVALKNETWKLVEDVRVRLIDGHVRRDRKILGVNSLDGYMKLRRNSGPGIFSGLRSKRMDGIVHKGTTTGWDMCEDLVVTSTVQGSDTRQAHRLFLGTNGDIYAFRGMTEEEHARGIIIPEYAFRPYEDLPQLSNYDEIRQGLANLVARNSITLP